MNNIIKRIVLASRLKHCLSREAWVGFWSRGVYRHLLDRGVLVNIGWGSGFFPVPNELPNELEIDCGGKHCVPFNVISSICSPDMSMRDIML